MAKTLLDFETAESPEFLTRQEKHRRANEKKGTEESKEDFEFYDVTSWSLPLAMGVEAYSTDEPVRGDIVEPIDNRQMAASASLGEGKNRSDQTQLSDGVAYAFEANSPQSMRLAVYLIQSGYRVDTSNDMFRASGQNFPRGSFILLKERNPAELPQILGQFAAQYGVTVRSVSSALSDDDDPGIGSEKIFPLKIPKVAVLAGEPGNQTSYGLLRFLLEQEYGIDLIPVPISNLTKDVLRHLNVLILPNGEASEYKGELDDERLGDLRGWVSEGGVLICIGGASEFAANPETKLTSSRILGTIEKAADEDKSGGSSDKTTEETAKKHKGSGEKKEAVERKPLEVPGAIVRAHVNHDDFLSIGYEDETQGRTFSPSREPNLR
jgi:hypothetical protein